MSCNGLETLLQYNRYMEYPGIWSNGKYPRTDEPTGGCFARDLDLTIGLFALDFYEVIVDEAESKIS